MVKYVKYDTVPTFWPCCSNQISYKHMWLMEVKETDGCWGHQLWPVSQVTTVAIVTSRLKSHFSIPRSCSGSAGSCPFTSTPHQWVRSQTQCNYTHLAGTSRRIGKWSAVSCACFPRQDHSNKGHDLPLSTTDLRDLWVISRHLKETVETTEWVFIIQMWFT